MFTGLITHIATVTDYTSGILTLNCEPPLENITLGESIAVNGCCLTVCEQGMLRFALSPETITRTAPMHKGAHVNLERALKLGDALGGHFVSGHVDGTLKLLSITPQDGSHVLRFETPAGYGHFIAEKGSITLNGISLTVSAVQADSFETCIIPHTWDATTLHALKPGDAVNFEIDLLARHVARLLEARA